jgi:hypothetical protein
VSGHLPWIGKDTRILGVANLGEDEGQESEVPGGIYRGLAWVHTARYYDRDRTTTLHHPGDTGRCVSKLLKLL